GPEEPGARRQRQRRVAERPADRGPGALGVPAREAQEREAGLGRLAEVVGLAERLLRRLEVAEAQTDLAELVERGAGDPRRPDAELLARLPGLLIRLAEPALEAHDL